MITCEVCGKVFHEHEHGEFNIHNSVSHLHSYKGTRYGKLADGFGYINFKRVFD